MSENENDNIWLKNRESLVNTKEKSEDDFEKNLVLITSGTLVLSMTFIDKIAPLDHARGVVFLIIAQSLLAISLLINLLSHQISVKYSQDAVDNFDLKGDAFETNKLIEGNNRKVRKINNWTVSLMISGIISLVVYCSINAYAMSKANSNKSAISKNITEGGEKMKNGRQTTVLIAPKPTITKPDTTKKNAK